MRAMNKLSAVVMLGLGLVGCGPVQDEDAGLIERIERDFGGARGVMDFFETHTDEEIRRAMEPYGVGFTTSGLITDCPKNFPTSDRNTWHTVGGEYYFIDGSGRPNRAYAYLPPIVAEARADSCQTSVGQWGDAENPSNDYDGGHLIGSQLGGWGKRANLVPQDANFNRGNWAQMENKMATCKSLPTGRLRYTVGANYPNSTTLIPNTMTMEIRNQSTGSTVSLSFSNTDSGGSNGTSERTRGVSFLTSQGCN